METEFFRQQFIFRRQRKSVFLYTGNERILCVRKDKPQPGERMMVIIMKADCSTDIGPVRASNQDTCECGPVFTEQRLGHRM